MEINNVIPIRPKEATEFFETEDGEQSIFHDGRTLRSANFSTTLFEPSDITPMSLVLSMFGEPNEEGYFFALSSSEEIQELMEELAIARDLMREAERNET
jgi:hypothetical protein